MLWIRSWKRCAESTIDQASSIATAASRTSDSIGVAAMLWRCLYSRSYAVCAISAAYRMPSKTSTWRRESVGGGQRSGEFSDSKTLSTDIDNLIQSGGRVLRCGLIVVLPSGQDLQMFVTETATFRCAVDDGDMLCRLRKRLADFS